MDGGAVKDFIYPINKKGSQLLQFGAVLKTTGGYTETVVPHRMTPPEPKTRYPPVNLAQLSNLNLDWVAVG